MANKVWVVIECGEVDSPDRILGVYASQASAEAEREKRMTRIDGLKPWDNAFVDEWEVQP